MDRHGAERTNDPCGNAICPRRGNMLASRSEKPEEALPLPWGRIPKNSAWFFTDGTGSTKRSGACLTLKIYGRVASRNALVWGQGFFATLDPRDRRTTRYPSAVNFELCPVPPSVPKLANGCSERFFQLYGSHLLFWVVGEKNIDAEGEFSFELALTQ